MLVDRLVSPYALLISLGFLVASILTGQPLVAIAILGWWLVSRFVRILPHLRREPSDIVVLPAFVVFQFLMAFIKVYALVTLHQHKWLTRPVEVVDGQVVRSGTTVSHTRLPLRNRLAGAGIALSLVVATQAALLALGGAGYLPRSDTAPPQLTVEAPLEAVRGVTVLRALAEDTVQTEGLSYRWLLNGLAAGTGSQLVIPPDMPSGMARWSVYVRDSEGNTAGASGLVEVTGQ